MMPRDFLVLQPRVANIVDSFHFPWKLEISPSLCPSRQLAMLLISWGGQHYSTCSMAVNYREKVNKILSRKQYKSQFLIFDENSKKKGYFNRTSSHFIILCFYLEIDEHNLKNKYSKNNTYCNSCDKTQESKQ